MSKLYRSTYLSLLASLLISCGDSDSSPPEVVVPPTPNSPPIAEAGEDMIAVAGAKVVLEGTGVDNDGSVVSYLWQQSEGTAAQIENTDNATTKVVLPELEQDEVLIFTLTVTDNDGGIHEDLVSIDTKAYPNWQLQRTVLLDVNNDQLVDIVTTYKSDYDISKLSFKLNNGQGVFSEETILDQNITASITSINAGNIDNKNGTDLSITTGEAVYNYYSDSQNQFLDKVLISADWVPDDTRLRLNSSLLLEDFNGDGLLDYSWLKIYSDQSGCSFFYCYSVSRAMNIDGQSVNPPESLGGAFMAYPGAGGSSIQGLRAADMNNDGISELTYVIKEGSELVRSSELRWFEKNEPAYIEGESEIQGNKLSLHLRTYERTRIVQLIDWDEDQDLDVLHWIANGGETSIKVDLYHNKLEENEFSSATEVTELNIIDTDLIIDMDNDGVRDFLKYRKAYQENTGSVVWQKKLISAVEPSQKLFDYSGDFLGAYDLDNDGHIDFIIKNGDTLSWYRNQGDLTFEEQLITLVE